MSRASNVAHIKSAVKNDLLTRATALGNSKTGLKEICSDLLNNYGRDKRSRQALQDGTFLAPSTLDRMRELSDCESGTAYKPNADTCERILRFFNAQLHFTTVRITPKNQNKAKTSHDDE